MANTFFITGTDGGVGKTIVTVGLLQAFAARNMSALAMKPVAINCQHTRDGLRSFDVELLQNNMALPLAYEQVNPYPLESNLPPHISAQEAGIRIDRQHVLDLYQSMRTQADVVLVEGTGGWKVPLDSQTTVEDLAVLLDIPVILVVGVQKGCINHALLTYEAILRAGVVPAGWVANIIQRDVATTPRIINAIQQVIHTPLVGIIPPFKEMMPRRVADFLEVDFLLGNTPAQG